MPPGGIRNRNPSQQAAADLRLRPRGQWDRQTSDTPVLNQVPHRETKANGRMAPRIFVFGG